MKNKRKTMALDLVLVVISLGVLGMLGYFVFYGDSILLSPPDSTLFEIPKVAEIQVSGDGFESVETIYLRPGLTLDLEIGEYQWRMGNEVREVIVQEPITLKFVDEEESWRIVNANPEGYEIETFYGESEGTRRVGGGI